MVHENNYKYLKAPTIEQIEAVVKAANVSESQFERFHGIYFGAIREVRMGKREMPAKYWHLFLEAPQPVAGKAAGLKLVETAPKRTNRIIGVTRAEKLT